MASRLLVRELHPSVDGTLVREDTEWLILLSPRMCGNPLVIDLVNDLMARLHAWEAAELRAQAATLAGA